MSIGTRQIRCTPWISGYWPALELVNTEHAKTDYTHDYVYASYADNAHETTLAHQFV